MERRVAIDKEIWTLPRPRKPYYPGSFPLHFEKKLIRLLNMDEIQDHEEIFHPFGGYAEFGIRNDLNPEVNPNYSLDAHDLSDLGSDIYKLVICDPPYNDKLSEEMYKTPPVKYKTYIEEAVRVCQPRGFIASYHWLWTPKPKGTEYHKIIVVLPGQWHRARICCIFRKHSH